MTKLYHVSTMSDSPAIPDASWIESVRGAVNCAAGHLKKRFWRSVIKIQDLGANVPYNFIDSVLIDYIRTEFYEALSTDADKCLTFGTLIDRQGSPTQGMRTIRRKHSIVIRGEGKSYCWRCKTCHKVQYYPIGKWYVLAQQVPALPVFLGLDLAMIVKEPVFRRLSKRRFKKLAIAELPILDEPLDGFPADLNKITPELERQ